MSKKAWIIFAAVVVLLLGGLIYLSGKNKLDVSAIDPNKIQSASAQSGNIADHVFGNQKSNVVIIEYGDFQCPGCGTAYPVIKAVTEKYKDQMAFVFRNLPLASLHPNARAAAAAAEAAGFQGKYFEMHDKLYANQSEWETLSSSDREAKFMSYAQNFGLDSAKFSKDFAGQSTAEKIRFDEAVFSKTGLPKSTPTLLINGKKVDQPVVTDQAKLDALVTEAIKSNTSK